MTLRQHYTAKQAKDQGMTREQARRYVDVLFLRRSTPTPDFSMVLDPETCWWSCWVSSPEENSQKIKLSVKDIVDACRRAGGLGRPTWRQRQLSACPATAASRSMMRSGPVISIPGRVPAGRSSTACRVVISETRTRSNGDR